MRSAQYHPFIDAAAFTLVDIPITAVIVIAYTLVLYFFTGFISEPSHYLYVCPLTRERAPPDHTRSIFLLMTIANFIVSKAFFRTLAASVKTPAIGQALAGFFLLPFGIFCGCTSSRFSKA